MELYFDFVVHQEATAILGRLYMLMYEAMRGDGCQRTIYILTLYVLIFSEGT